MLPFAALDPDAFERQCLWLLVREGYTNVQHYGLGGSDGGRDLVAVQMVGGAPQRWVFQCKRQQRVTAPALTRVVDAIATVARSDPSAVPYGVAFMIATAVSARTRDAVTAHALAAGFQCEFWAVSELDERAQRHPDLVEEFFQLAVSRRSATIPRGIPRAPLRFVNRHREMDALTARLATTSDQTGASLVVVQGMHGVGKSALGAYWSHQHRSAFAHGDLYASFARHEGSAPPDPSDVLARFLRDLGTTEEAIPPSYAERQALYVKVTSSKRLLVLLDDIEFDSQVTELLPSGAGSLVVATTNRRLERLARAGADLIDVEPLDPATAESLLHDLIGDDRLDQDPSATATLIHLCGGLPVALCVSGGRLRHYSQRSVGWLVRRITAEPQTHAGLARDATWWPVFDVAYGDLSPSVALLYRRAALHPGRRLTAPATAALADIAATEAEQALEVLYDAFLVEAPDDDSFALHDLVRWHARTIADRGDDEATRRVAIGRLVDWYYASLRAADRAIVQDRLRLTDDATVDASAVPVMSSKQDAFSWFATERENVMAVQREAESCGMHERVWQFAEALWPLCASHKLFTEWIESHQRGIQASLDLGNLCAEARLRSQLARAYAELGRFDDADTEMSAAMLAAEVCGNVQLQASVVEFGGVCQLRAGDPAGALEGFEQARSIFDRSGNRRGVALQDLYRGYALLDLGRPWEAIQALDVAQVSLRAADDEISVARALIRAGQAWRAVGDLTKAMACLLDGIAIMDQLKIVFEQAEAYEALAAISTESGNARDAADFRQQAQRLYVDLGHPRAQALSST